MSETVTPLLPIGAGRLTDFIWPGVQQNITVGSAGMTADVTPRPGSQDYSGANPVAYAGGSAVGALIDNVPCYNLKGASAGDVGAGCGFLQRVQPIVQQLTQNLQAIGSSCTRIVAMCCGAFVGDSGADVGLQICAGARFPNFCLFGDSTPGFQFGPRGIARVSFRARFAQGGPLTVDQDVAAGFMANITPNAWNQYEIRIISASKTEPGVIKCLVNGIQVLGDISMDPALGTIVPPYLPATNAMFYSWGVVNRGADNSPNFYVRSIECMTGPNETSLL